MREVNFGPGTQLEDALRLIEDASREDALTIADGFHVTNVPATPVTTLDVSTATLADVIKFVATLVDQLQKRGPNRVE